jgi:hypothetical protein
MTWNLDLAGIGECLAQITTFLFIKLQNLKIQSNVKIISDGHSPLTSPDFIHYCHHEIAEADNQSINPFVLLILILPVTILI